MRPPDPPDTAPKPGILLIAPLPGAWQSETNIIGGNKLMASEQIRELGARGFDLEAIDASGDVTNLAPWRIRTARLTRFLRVAWGAARKLRGADIVFLIVSSPAAPLLALFFWAVCTLTRTPLVVRVSGGDLRRDYLAYSPLARWLAERTWLRSTLVYVETQQLLQSFDNRANFRWFPNTRDIQPPARTRRDQVSKLIFLARLEMAKGLGEALEACGQLPETCHLNVFGPGMSDTAFSLFDGNPGASYRGVLDPEQIPQVLAEHDLLVYPSYSKIEGYPGSVLEAFQCGLPVVAARWGGVAELVEHEENGLLVEPRSAAAVKAAIERLLEDPDLYRRLCEGAERSGERFRSANWYDRVASDLHSLCRRKTPVGKAGQTAG